MSISAEPNERSAGALKFIHPFGVATILFAAISTTYTVSICLARLVRAMGGVWDGDVWEAFTMNLTLTQDNAVLILMSLSAWAVHAREHWRSRVTLFALGLLVLQFGLGMSLKRGPAGEWFSWAYFVGWLSTNTCFAWAMVSSVRNGFGIPVSIALLTAMPLLPFDPTFNRSVPLCVLAALPNCSRQLTAPIIACGVFALGHLVRPGFALGIPWTLASLWVVVKGWRLASSWPAGSSERTALRAGLFLVAISLLPEQMHLLQQALLAKSRMPRMPLSILARFATGQGFTMIVAAKLMRNVHSSEVTTRRVRAVIAVGLAASLEIIIMNELPTLPLSVVVLAMSILLGYAIGAQLRFKSLAGD